MSDTASPSKKTSYRPDVPASVLEQVAALPLKPGVYQFYDEYGRLLYIGKATRLRSRVQSYFRASTDLSGPKQFMVSQIRSIKTTVVETEPEALLLETTLIKKHKPPYNVVMKDDKNFKYIHITEDDFPRLETVRKLPAVHRRRGRYFGPYTSGKSVNRTLRLLKELFLICTKPPITKKGEVVYPDRPCLEYHLGRCIGPCARAVTPEEYQRIFLRIEQFLKGDYEEIRSSVEQEMYTAAQEEYYERAARLRDQMEAVDQMMEEQNVISASGRDNADYLSLAVLNSVAAVNIFIVRKGKVFGQDVIFMGNVKGESQQDIMDAFINQYYAQTVTKPKKIVTSLENRRGRHRRLLAMGMENAEEALVRRQASFEKRTAQAEQGLAELGAALGMDPEQLKRIEVYDISHHQGAYTVGSMIVFTDGMPDKSQYRKFKVKTVQGPDDFASLREVLNRRMGHLPSIGSAEADIWARPDLMIIDGGKGQLSAVTSLLDAAKIDIPTVSLAKREEEIFVPGESTPILLPMDSEGLKLVQRMRDEAHRFAIGFYRQRHLKNLV